MTIELRIEEGSSSSALSELVNDRVASRIFACDGTLWGEEAAAEASVRLGWTDFTSGVDALIDEIDALRAELLARGLDRVLLCGMGGSSLAPAVISRWGGVKLEVIDSTHPDTLRVFLTSDLSRALVVVSSKSGGTIETLSHRAAFTRAFVEAGLNPADHILVVTDPGSPLEEEALAAGQRVFSADPEVGGRFSALTAFGLVPAGLAGADIRTLVAEAQAALPVLSADTATNPALLLADTIASGLPKRYVLGLVESPDARWGLASWIEQLVAESTGKDGKGVLPIALPSDAVEVARTPANTRIVRLGAAGSTTASAPPAEMLVAAPLGAQMLLWEVATAVLGRIMGIDPFNQPDVESAKIAARAQLDAVVPDGAPIAAQEPAALLAVLRDKLPAGGYLAIQAYLDPKGPTAPLLMQLRDALAGVLDAPVALCWGPRYLHSTGQFHKGGPALGTFLQITEQDLEPLSIPGSENGFETLIAAQARGDRDVLESRGRSVVTLTSEDPVAALQEMLAAVVP